MISDATHAISEPAATPGKDFTQHTMIDGVAYKVASCREERAAAFRLVYDSYLQSGLMEPNTHRMRITPFHLLPTTDIFNATHQGRLIYTMSLVSDDMGLPMDDIYDREICGLREQGIRLAEVSCLASRQSHFPRSRMFDVFIQLVGLMFQYARQNDIQQLVIVCHPRHVRFYQRFLGFKQIGDQRLYSSVRDNPAIACSHDFAQLDKSPYRLYDQVYGHPYQSWELLRQPMLREERSHFEEKLRPSESELAPFTSRMYPESTYRKCDAA